MKTPTITEGDYLMTLRDQRETVRVMETYLYESPNRKTALKAHVLSGYPRFPWLVSELVEAGATFRRLP